MDFGELRRFIDDCLTGQDSEPELDCPQSEEEFLGLLSILRDKLDSDPGTASSFPPYAPSKQLLALRAERARHEAILRAAKGDPATTKGKRKRLRRDLRVSMAEVTALEARERKEYLLGFASSLGRPSGAWWIVQRVERDIRRAFEFGTARPTRRLPWHLLPPGELTIERLRRHYKGLQHRDPHARYDVERLEKAFSLGPEACYVGTDEFEGYVVFTFAQTKRALLECPIYGNAIYVLGPDWRRLSKRSKQEILAERPDGVKKIVHSGDWFGRVKTTLGLR
jgi:hypothetical protein